MRTVAPTQGDRESCACVRLYACACICPQNLAKYGSEKLQLNLTNLLGVFSGMRMRNFCFILRFLDGFF